MSLDNAKNFAKVVVSGIYGTTETQVTLRTGDGTKLPTVSFNNTWWNSSVYNDPSDDPNVEIVRCTNIAGDLLTITRAQESTTASSKNTPNAVYRMIAGFTAKSFNIDIPAIPSSSLSSVSGSIIATPGIGQGHIAPNSLNLAHMLLPSTSGNVISTPGIGQGHIAPNSLNLAHMLLPSVSGNVIATPAISAAHLAQNTQFTFSSGITLGLSSVAGPLYGQTTLAAGSGSAVTTAVNVNSLIMLCVGNPGANTNQGTPMVHLRSPGRGFNIRSTNASDNSSITWMILN